MKGDYVGTCSEDKFKINNFILLLVFLKQCVHCASPPLITYIYITIPTGFLPTQLSHKLQWEVRGGRKVLQVKQYLSFTTCWLMRTSLVLGGGRYEDDPEVS